MNVKDVTRSINKKHENCFNPQMHLIESEIQFLAEAVDQLRISLINRYSEKPNHHIDQVIMNTIIFISANIDSVTEICCPTYAKEYIRINTLQESNLCPDIL